jgi:ParB-like chromosome segregation protein Spo0J
MQYELHDLCKILPDMSADQFRAHVADIRANGLLHPIVLHEGKILDGRHRYRACVEIGIEPKFTSFGGVDALAFVLSENLHRRHLSESQRAMVAAKLANMRQGHRSDKQPSANWQKVSATDAAKSLNVSERSVARAVEIKKNGAPELVAKVEAGEITVNEAERVAHLGHEAQRRIVAVDNKQSRMNMTEKALNASAGAKRRHAPTPTAPSEPGTQFVRLFLGRMEHLANDIAAREDIRGMDAIRDKFLREFDPNDERLAEQFKHVRQVMLAIGEIARRA